MTRYEIYYVAKENRLESMMVCALNSEIDWSENGLHIMSWTYNKVAGGKGRSLDSVLKKYSVLKIDRRKKKQMRSICIGDIIVFDGVPWIITGFGFSAVPDFLWNEIAK